MSEFLSMFNTLWPILTWLHLFLMIAAVVVSLRYRRLAPQMPLVIAGFLGLCAKEGLLRVLFLLQTAFSFDPAWLKTASSLGYLLGLASWLALVVGLALVWKDLRDRIEFLQLIHDESRQKIAETAP